MFEKFQIIIIAIIIIIIIIIAARRTKPWCSVSCSGQNTRQCNSHLLVGHYKYDRIHVLLNGFCPKPHSPIGSESLIIVINSNKSCNVVTEVGVTLCDVWQTSILCLESNYFSKNVLTRQNAIHLLIVIENYSHLEYCNMKWHYICRFQFSIVCHKFVNSSYFNSLS